MTIIHSYSTIWLGTQSFTLRPNTLRCTITSSENVSWLEMSTCNTSTRTCRRPTSSRRPWEPTRCGSSRQTYIFLFSNSWAWVWIRSRVTRSRTEHNKRMNKPTIHIQSLNRPEGQSKPTIELLEVAFEGACWESNSTSLVWKHTLVYSSM